MTWKRNLCGVEFRVSLKDEEPMLLGSLCHEVERMRSHYPGEPRRALVFQTRDMARLWCAEQLAKNAGRSDCCAEWRFKPVRVLETVRKV